MATTKTLQCSVITPEDQIFDGEAESVVIPAFDGEVGVMPDRAPLLCMLGAGEMRVYRSDGQQRWFINGGFAQVIDNRVIVLTQEAVPTEDLDVTEAERLLAEAQEMKVTDEISARRKADAEAGARAQKRLARR